MGYKVLAGTDFGEEFLSQVMELDRRVYDEKYAGELDNMVARYRANRDSFICIYDADGKKLAGYINFFPGTPELCESLRTTKVIRDDDITAEEVAQYGKDCNHLFILSIVVAEEYRNGEVIRMLTDAWIAHLNGLESRGHAIEGITAIAVSEDGMKALGKLRFTKVRELEDGNIVYVCCGEELKKLLSHDI